MEAENPVIERKRGAGRPGLSHEQLAEIVGALATLSPKTPEFREKRLLLATKFKRTENAIIKAFMSAIRDHAKKNAPALPHEETGA